MFAAKKKLFWASAIIIGIILLVSFGLGLWEQKEDLAPDFTLQDINGNVIRLSDFRGQVVLLNFMATWCPECRREMPVLGQEWAKYKDSIILISIDVDPTESTEELRDFAESLHYATWIWAKDTANLVRAYGVIEIPKTVLIDKDGYIRFVHTGAIGEQTLNSQIERLLG